MARHITDLIRRRLLVLFEVTPPRKRHTIDKAHVAKELQPVYTEESSMQEMLSQDWR